MIYTAAALLTTFFTIGALCSWTDIRSGIVPNRYLLIGIILGVILHVMNIFIGNAPFYPSWLYNMIIADLLAILMYAGKIWAAGDAKLSMVLFFLLPPQLLDPGSLTYGVIPYIFTFILAFLWLIIDSILRFIKHEPPKAPPRSPIKGRLLEIGTIFIESTALYCFFILLFNDFLTRNELLAAVIMIVHAYICSNSSFMRKWHIVAAHIAVIILTSALGKWHFSLPDFRSYLLLALALLLQRFSSRYNYKQIQTAQVRPNMVLSAETIIQFSLSRVQGLPSDSSEELLAGITSDEVDAVKRWEFSARGQSTIWIVRKIFFAVVIFIGFLTWIIVRLLG